MASLEFRWVALGLFRVTVYWATRVTPHATLCLPLGMVAIVTVVTEVLFPSRLNKVHGSSCPIQEWCRSTSCWLSVPLYSSHPFGKLGKSPTHPVVFNLLCLSAVQHFKGKEIPANVVAIKAFIKSPDGLMTPDQCTVYIRVYYMGHLICKGTVCKCQQQQSTVLHTDSNLIQC